MFAKTLERPTLVRNRNWQPVHVVRIASWSKFLSEVYWKVTLQE